MNKVFIFLIVLTYLIACKNNDLIKKEYKLVVYTQGLNNNHLPIEIQKLFEPITGQCENGYSPFSTELNSPIIKRIDTNFNGQLINISKDKITDFKNISLFKLDDNFTIENKEISNLELLNKISQFKSTDLMETYILNENSGMNSFDGIPIIANINTLKKQIDKSLCVKSTKQITVIYLNTVINDELVTNYENKYKTKTKSPLASETETITVVKNELNKKVEKSNIIENNNSLVANNTKDVVKINDVSDNVKPVVNKINEPLAEATKAPLKTTLDELINDSKSDYIPPIKKTKEIKKQIEKPVEKPIVEATITKPKATVIKPAITNTPTTEVKVPKTKKPKTTEPLEGIWNRKADDVKNDNKINSKDIRKKG